MKRAVIPLIVFFLACGAETNLDPLGFSRGAEPVAFQPGRDTASSPDGTPWIDAKSCRECHTEVFDNWNASRHRAAFTNKLYQESHAREPMQWCVNCHAPLLRPGADREGFAGRVLKEEGISCNVCHVRGGAIIAARLPDPAPGRQRQHKYTVLPALASAAFCESCHQFDFPGYTATLPGQPMQFSGLPMQNTVEEWKSGGLSGVTCQGCHVLSNTRDTHRFSGGHDLARLKESIHVRLARTGSASARAEVLSLGIGHNFPTGDLFRALRIRIYAGERLLHEEVFKKEYRNLTGHEIHPEGPTKALTADTTIPPPSAGDYASSRTFEFKVPRDLRLLRVDLHMDYLHGANHLLTTMPAEETQPLFKREYILLEDKSSEVHG